MPGLVPAGGPRGFLRGAAYPFRGALHLAANVPLWPRAFLPFLVYLATLLALGTAAFFLVDDVFRWIRPETLAEIPHDAGLVRTLTAAVESGVVALVALVLLIATVVLGTVLVATVLAGPFNELLSAAVELRLTGAREAEGLPGIKGITRDLVRGIVVALLRLALFCALYAPLLFLTLIPFVDVVAGALLIALSAFFAAQSFLDPAFDRHRLTFGQRLAFSRATLSTTFGFGLVLVLLLLVPVLNLMLAPAFVVGGTLFWIEHRGIVPTTAPVPGGGRAPRTPRAAEEVTS